MTTSRHIRDTYPARIVCIKCGVEKPVADFRPNGRGKGRTRTDCKVCERLTTAAARKRLGVVLAAKLAREDAQRRRIKNPDLRREYLAKNPARRVSELNRARQYKKENAAKVNAIQARRKAVKRQATPAWANTFFIEEIYDLAQRRSKMTGIEWQVDHVAPLKSKLVCGLHVEHNLQVIPAKANQSKKNYWWPDMPN